MEKRVLVIGQGLAGTLLSSALEEHSIDFKLIDQPDITHSSRVAAGLFNPVTGRKMVLTWKAPELFPLLHKRYRQLEQRLNTTFLYDIPIYRPFIDRAEQNDWEARQADPVFAPFISEVVTRPIHAGQVINPFGGLRLKQAGWLDIPALLESWRDFLADSNRLMAVEFKEDQLEQEEGGWRYDGEHFTHVVYCNGKTISESKYWHWLPMRPVKGEILDIEAEVLLPEVINRGVFFLPLPDGGYRAGSTYHQQDLSLVPTEQGKKEILDKLDKLISMPYRVKNQRVGIRPATKDRRPLVGSHPVHQTLMVVNGLGTKGVSLAPYCAEAMLALLKREDLPDAAINTDRFFSLYYS